MQSPLNPKMQTASSPSNAQGRGHFFEIKAQSCLFTCWQSLLRLEQLLTDEKACLQNFGQINSDTLSKQLENLSEQKNKHIQAIEAFNTDFVRASKLESEQDALNCCKSLLEHCQKQNLINGELLFSYEERIEHQLSFLQGQTEPLNTYNRQGLRQRY